MRRSTSKSRKCRSGCGRTGSSSRSSPSIRAASRSSSTRSSSRTSARASCLRLRAERRCAQPSCCSMPSRAPSIQLLPIETRLKDTTIQEFRNYADEWTTFALDLSNAAKMSEALARVSEVKRVPIALARALGLQDDPDSPNPLRDGDARIDVPAWRHAIINFPHPLLQQGLVDPRHARTQRGRRRARAHAQPASQCACHPVRSRGRHRRHEERPRRLAARSGRRRSGAKSDAARRARTRSTASGTSSSRKPRSPRRFAVRSMLRRRCSGIPSAQVFPVSAQKGLLAKVNGDDALLQRSGLPGARGCAVREAHSGEARYRRRGDAIGGSTRSPTTSARSSNPGSRASPSSSRICASCAGRIRTSSLT